MTNFLPFSVALMFLTLAAGVAQAETPSPTPSPGSGLVGTIILHGISAGPVRQGVPDFKPLADITFVVQQEDREIASFTTDKLGQFQVALPPGHYTIRRKNWKSRVGFYGPFEVDVTKGELTKVSWDCQTGMQ